MASEQAPTLRRRSIKTKVLLLTIVPVTAGMLGIGAFLFLAQAQRSAEDAVRSTLALKNATQQASTALDELQNAESAEFFGTEFAPTQGTVDQARSRWLSVLADLRELAETDPKVTELLTTLEQQVVDRSDLITELAPTLLVDGKLDLSGFSADPLLMVRWALPDQTIARIEAMADERLIDRSEAAEAARRQLQTAAPILVGIGLFLSLLLALRLGTQLVGRLKQVQHNAELLARGEELEPVESDPDEIGQLADQLVSASWLLASRESELHEAAAAADQANRAKSEFLSRMSHELRTPLNSILGFGQLLEMSDLNDDDRDSVAKIMTGGRHLLGLIDEVLDVSRIESGAMELSLEPVNLSDAVSTIVELVAPMARARGLTFTIEDATFEDTWVRADARRLTQVLLNLASNAVKYNDDNGTVTIYGRRRGDEVDISVSDTGRGIDPDHMHRLFTPFDRLGAADTGVEGTGLGLALSKRLIEAMDGTIRAESDPGHGSTFTVSLPVAEATAMPFESDQVPEGEPIEGADLVVLYIEDNLANLRLLERVIDKRPGVKLLSAMQGRLGIELARMHRPDLILLDLHLPDLSGEEVLERIRADAGMSHMRVVAVSADATPHRIERLREYGVDEYITKPYDVGDLLTLIDSYAPRSEVTT